MILKAKERGNAAQLADYLLTLGDNEQVELHEVRGFVSEELSEAFQEAEVIAKGTKCKKHLFSMSLNPPESEVVARQVFEQAIEKIERKLDLEGHPRAIVFHEKDGRRHAHAVWSRIDSETMRAKNMSFYKQKLMDVSRNLFLDHGWNMPSGMIDRALRNPMNFTLAEWQQAQRAKTDPRLIKTAIRGCWESSDSQDTLKAALEEKGFFLAKGDRRAVVALDVRGEVYSLSRMAGVKAKDVRARLKDQNSVPSVTDVKKQIADRMTEQLRSYLRDADSGTKHLRPSIEFKRVQMTERHARARKIKYEQITKRETQETLARAARLPKGFSGIWGRITGKLSKLKARNEIEALQCWQRDRAEKDALIARQLDERQRLQQTICKMRDKRAQELADIHSEIAAYLAMKRGDVPSIITQRKPDRARKRKVDAERKRSRNQDQNLDFGPEL